MLFLLGDIVPGSRMHSAGTILPTAPIPHAAGCPYAGYSLHKCMHHSCCCSVITMTLFSVMYMCFTYVCVCVSVVVSMCVLGTWDTKRKWGGTKCVWEVRAGLGVYYRWRIRIRRAIVWWGPDRHRCWWVCLFIILSPHRQDLYLPHLPLGVHLPCLPQWQPMTCLHPHPLYLSPAAPHRHRHLFHLVGLPLPLVPHLASAWACLTLQTLAPAVISHSGRSVSPSLLIHWSPSTGSSLMR